MRDNFYRAFEERYYAPQEVIKELRKQYLPFITPLGGTHRGENTFDIGCGRGEWLELMAEIGFNPYGVDLDEGMLQACKDKGLPAEKGDAVVFLGNLPSESQVVVTAFHVVEHLSFEQLRSVVSEAHRVLKPGGLLIMETPNPENIIVSTQNFYLDPTHQRPIPWQLLSFLPEHSGFARVKTMRLQEKKDLLQKTSLTIKDLFTGVSPDYAVIAQKAATDQIFQLLDPAFLGEYGLSFDVIADRYHKQTKADIQAFEKTAEEAMKLAQQAEAKAQQTEHALNLIYSSRSWRLTAPLRWFGLQLRLLYEHGLRARLKALTRKLLKSIAHHVVYWLDTYPHLRKKVIALIKKTRMDGRLRSFYHKITQRGYPQTFWSTYNYDPANGSLSQLSPRARRIYYDLKNAIERNKEQKG